MPFKRDQYNHQNLKKMQLEAQNENDIIKRAKKTIKCIKPNEKGLKFVRGVK